MYPAAQEWRVLKYDPCMVSSLTGVGHAPPHVCFQFPPARKDGSLFTECYGGGVQQLQVDSVGVSTEAVVSTQTQGRMHECRLACRAWPRP